jgi:hypothetical protein
MNIENAAIRSRAYRALGLANIWRVATHRIALKIGIHPVQRLHATLPPGPYFGQPGVRTDCPEPPETWKHSMLFYGHLEKPMAGVPDFLTSIASGRHVAADLPWWKIADFSDDVGDIKGLWEPSRFAWVQAFAQQAACGDEGAFAELNRWIAGWVSQNPAYLGPNWKCGQEASIRVLQLLIATCVLDATEAPLPALLDFVEIHLRRVAPTTAYAIAQDNNHATSEGAALWAGGAWLARHGRKCGNAWSRQGRDILEERVAKLIADDGGFSLYSVNYHRVVIDTLSFIEVWRRRLDLPPFSETFATRARAATGWLDAMVDPATGEAPNIGANDGTRLLAFGRGRYDDYRPSIQLARAVFFGQRRYQKDSVVDAGLDWLRIDAADGTIPSPVRKVFDDSGFAVIENGLARVTMRYPRFAFRPGHADALHVDLSLQGRNVLRDGGSFSYLAPEQTFNYFTGVESHNTVQFDGREQMPRLGRFLFGDWLTTTRRSSIVEEDGTLCFEAEYAARKDIRHRRRLYMSGSGLKVVDEIAGVDKHATIRWRLAAGDWTSTPAGAHSADMSIVFSGTSAPKRTAIVTGYESRNYLEQSALPVLEIDVVADGYYTTEFTWA